MKIIAIEDVDQIGQGVQLALVIRAVDFNHIGVPEDIEHLEKV